MFRTQLPRIYELRDLIEPPSPPSACLQDLDASLRYEPKMRAFRAREEELQVLDSDSWDALKQEARPYLTKWDERRGRQQLFDMLNQARGYIYLKSICCSSIQFIPRSDQEGERTPDLQGVIGSITVLCEVKTINISDDEAEARKNGSAGGISAQLGQGFFTKLMSNLTEAKEQLEARCAGEEARRIVYFIINFDDFWAEYKDKYFDQIDHYLCENAPPGIEIVFHNQVTPFHTAITMKFATVFNPDELKLMCS